MPDNRPTLTVFCGSRCGARESYLKAATEFGREAAARGMRLAYGGGRLGLMGAVAEAALEAGGAVIGVIPRYLCREEVLHTGLTETHIVNNLFERKQRMIDIADAFVSLPGGFGTLDEYFEIASWTQLGQIEVPNILVNIEGYFDPLVRLLEHTVAEDFARPEHLARILVVDSVPALFDHLALSA